MALKTATKRFVEFLLFVSLLSSLVFTIIASHGPDCSCPEAGGLTVTTVVPWIIIVLLFLFVHFHFQHCRGIAQNFNGKSLRQQMKAQEASEVQILSVNSNLQLYENEENLPLKSEQFRGLMQIATEFIIEYLGNVGSYPVTSDNKPGFLCKVLPKQMPKKPEAFSAILADMYEHILPGMAHWLHPQFHGYFPTGSSYPDILAETIISALGVVAFSWDSAPSITELEVVMVNWMARAMGLSENFCFGVNPSESEGGGAVQPSASDAVFIAVLSARYKKLCEYVAINDPDVRQKTADVLGKLVAYASAEAHTCIEKACNLALVRLRLVRSNVDDFALHGKTLEREIKKDHERGLIPFFIHATAGTTSVASFDRIRELSILAKRYNAWLHVDAAYAGAALICPEFRHLMDGINEADSLNMNLHKMLLSSVTCSLLWTKHQRVIREAFEAEPLYLKRTHVDAMDFRHWGVSLSRRAKALKLWFLLRMYGTVKLQEYIRRLVRLTARLKCHLLTDSRIELVGQQNLSLVCFHIKDYNKEAANRKTKEFCEYINRSKRLLITRSSPRGIEVIRLCVGQERLREENIDETWRIIKELLDEYISGAAKIRFGDVRFLHRADKEWAISPCTTVSDTQQSSMEQIFK